jgi:curved DNA-binding protein CbpA
MAIRKPTLYQLLMVDPGVDDDVLTVVYRRLVQRANLAYEDDGQRRERLSVIEQAYAILHDPDRRRRYDLRVAGIAADDAETVTKEPVAVTPADRHSPVDPIEGPRQAVAVTPTPKPVPIVSSGGARIIDFGRYAGQSLRQIALRDPDYLEWLRRTPGGRYLQSDISMVLTPR